MVLYIKHPDVLNYLLENEFVYTLRKNRRKVGKDWVTKYAGCDKVADVEVKLIGPVRIDGESAIVENWIIEPSWTDKVKHDLNRFVKWSGFKSVEDWLKAFRVFAGKNVKEAWLYRVKLLNEVEGSE